MNKCVYLHKDINGVVKYVGSGTKERPFSKRNRNNLWLEYFKNNTLIVEILKENLTKEEAIKLETELYYKYKETILNLHEPNTTRVMDFSLFDKYFYLDSDSKSGLRYKNNSAGSRHHYKVGDDAGHISGTKEKPYWKVYVRGNYYLAHRVIYLLKYGSLDTSKVINHIDGNSLNNNLNNLEEIYQTLNSLKKKKAERFDTPMHGVSKVAHNGFLEGYNSYFTFNNKRITQRFTIFAMGSEEYALEAAITFRKYCEIKYGENPRVPDKEILNKMERIMRKVSSLRSSNTPEQLVSGKWIVRLTLNKKRITLKHFDSYEEAISSRDKYVQEYNNNLIITLP